MNASIPQGISELALHNPYPGAVNLHCIDIDSTMNGARLLVRAGFPPGTTLSADFQSAGRGRGDKRQWLSAPTLNLTFTIILEQTESALRAFPIKVGLTLRRAILSECSCIQPESLQVKWPNDIIAGNLKLAGILCESTGDRILAGMGINCNQTTFPDALATHATSLKLLTGQTVERWRILENFLEMMKADGENASWQSTGWRQEAEACLWKKGSTAGFSAGSAGSERLVRGKIMGIGEDGALLIEKENGSIAAFHAGEISLDRP